MGMVMEDGGIVRKTGIRRANRITPIRRRNNRGERCQPHVWAEEGAGGAGQGLLECGHHVIIRLTHCGTSESLSR